MKKTLLTLVASIALLITACGGSNYADQIISKVEAATEKVQNATTAEEVSAAAEELKASMLEIAQNAGDAQISTEEQAKINEASVAFALASQEKLAEFVNFETGEIIEE